MKEKKYFDSLDKLASGCATSQLLDNVRRVLMPQGHLTWEFLSASVEGVVSRAEFLSRPTDAGVVFRLRWEWGPQADRGHIEPVLDQQTK